MKAAAVQALKAEHPLGLLMQIAGLARSTYYAQLARLARPDPHTALDAAIVTAATATKRRYGHRRMRTVLQRQGYRVSKKTVYRRMHALGVLAVPRRSRQSRPRPGADGMRPNRLNRQFTANRPNQIWVTDMTEFRVRGERLYLAPVMDLFDRQIIGYALGRSASVQLAVRSLRMASQQVAAGQTPLIHTDQGVPYRHREWEQLLMELNATGSMSRQGTPLDNAVIESFFSHLKRELRPTTFGSIAALEVALHAHVHWYNHDRITNRPGGLSPVAYRTQMLAQPQSGGYFAV